MVPDWPVVIAVGPSLYSDPEDGVYISPTDRVTLGVALDDVSVNNLAPLAGLSLDEINAAFARAEAAWDAFNAA